MGRREAAVAILRSRSCDVELMRRLLEPIW